MAAVAAAATLARSRLGLWILAAIGAILALVVNVAIAVSLFAAFDGTLSRLSRRAGRGDRVARGAHALISCSIVAASWLLTGIAILGLSLLSPTSWGWTP